MRIGSWRIGRRSFLLGSAFTSAMAASLLSQSRIKAQAPAIITSDKLRPTIPYGVASGDITDNRATIWSRCDRPAQTIVEYSTDESFRKRRRYL
ncbi:PhoD-like phosphatase N-terminal domain-containing protein [Chroococcidiopsis sp [FACHB-1243]]|uniref:PhoD-like phosphatase N-terminal domain-containing protein n=1 Tax=Chroococcidiopsis sp. [FACHB-1243] TaxID=2692781 RepID=UPI001F552EA8|nr:PhoD-like phosphatase N-terminal domain-containing protein [Chroococcidiopsis sp. [FACHB-1243]]